MYEIENLMRSHFKGRIVKDEAKRLGVPYKTALAASKGHIKSMKFGVVWQLFTKINDQARGECVGILRLKNSSDERPMTIFKEIMSTVGTIKKELYCGSAQGEIFCFRSPINESNTAPMELYVECRRIK